MTLKEFVEATFICIIQKIGIDRPNNFDDILSFLISDVEETSSYLIDGNYTSEDVNIAFRRFLEKGN